MKELIKRVAIAASLVALTGFIAYVSEKETINGMVLEEGPAKIARPEKHRNSAENMASIQPVQPYSIQNSRTGLIAKQEIRPVKNIPIPLNSIAARDKSRDQASMTSVPGNNVNAPAQENKQPLNPNIPTPNATGDIKEATPAIENSSPKKEEAAVKTEDDNKVNENKSDVSTYTSASSLQINPIVNSAAGQRTGSTGAVSSATAAVTQTAAADNQKQSSQAQQNDSPEDTAATITSSDISLLVTENLISLEKLQEMLELENSL